MVNALVLVYPFSSLVVNEETLKIQKKKKSRKALVKAVCISQFVIGQLQAGFTWVS